MRRAKLKSLLARYECPQVTFMDEVFPLFIRKAKAQYVWDAEGRRFTDWTSFFGASLLGHNEPSVQKAIENQLHKLSHSMGDVHPAEIKALALKEAAGHLKLKEYQGILSLSGSEAIESLIKTVIIATGKSKILCFQNAYHGLSFGALSLTSLEKFRKPFRQWFRRMPSVPFPETEKEKAFVLERIERYLKKDKDIGAVLLEPIQGRGGVRIPPDGFFRELCDLCHQNQVLFCTDEIFTGFYRAGFALYTQREGVLPDLVAVGKAMGNGFPVSCCFGKKELMQAWGRSAGEAIHTSTFLGHPLSCAAALAVCQVQRKTGIRQAVRRKAKELQLLKSLEKLSWVKAVRGIGLMWGIEVKEGFEQSVHKVLKAALQSGHILLSSGSKNQVLSLTPPVCISVENLASLVSMLEIFFGDRRK